MRNHQKKLRIATMVTGHFTIPQPTGVVYAPIDLAVALTEGLVGKGHQVTFFAPEGSRIPESSNVETLDLQPLLQQRKDLLQGMSSQERGKIQVFWEQYIISHMFERARRGEYDILHIHPADMAHPVARSYPDVPAMYTLHDPIFPWRKEIYTIFASPNQSFVSISNSQRKDAPHLQYIATIYNGINLESFPFQEKASSNLLFVGRMHAIKGVIQAIEVAERAQEQLILVGSKGDKDYWDDTIAPRLNDKIRYAGFIKREELHSQYSQAKALLMPIQWEEPFGLVMIEAMACGTPVIAFRRGAVPEVVVDGKTGFIVDTVEEMTAAIQRLPEINPADCRAHVEENFSIKKMVDSYEQAYYKILEQQDKQNK